MPPSTRVDHTVGREDRQAGEGGEHHDWQGAGDHRRIQRKPPAALYGCAKIQDHQLVEQIAAQNVAAYDVVHRDVAHRDVVGPGDAEKEAHGQGAMARF